MELTEKIMELAGKPRFTDEEDVLVEPISALEELYASIPYSTDRPDGTQREHSPEGKIPMGERNNVLTSLAGTMRRRGMGEDSIFVALTKENEAKCKPPLSEDEVSSIARGIQRYEPGDPYYVSPGTPPFPSSSLPPSLNRLAQEAATSIGCAPEFIAVPMLATLGAAVGNSYVLEIKKGWTEPAVLYVAVVADPGEKKSPALKVATAPAKRRQMALKREYEKAMSDYHAQRRQWEVEKKRAKDNDEPAPPPPLEPVLPRTVVSDTTVEALADRLEANSRGILCSRDELSGWAQSMNQYKQGNGADRQQWLEMWSTGSIFVDRKSRREPLVVSRAFVCMVGSIQPKILPEIGSGREDGLLDRLLFTHPDPVASRYSDDEISDEAIADYEKLYDRLYELPMLKDENGEPNLLPMTLTPSAREIFRSTVDSLREEMERPGFPDYLKGPWSKLEAYLARLSLILALVRLVDQDHPDPPHFDAVKEQDVQAAVDLLDYFKGHARKVYAKLYGENPENLLYESIRVFLEEMNGYWEGMTEELFKILEDRSAAGLPGGSVPFGKMIRKLARQKRGFVLKNGHRGSQPIVKLSIESPSIIGAEETKDPKSESTESKSEDIATDVEDDEEPMPYSAPSSDTIAQTNLGETEDIDPDDDAEMEWAQILEIERVLREKRVKHPDYLTSDANGLIEEGVFYDLDFAPTPGLVEEAQLRIFEENDQKTP